MLPWWSQWVEIAALAVNAALIASNTGYLLRFRRRDSEQTQHLERIVQLDALLTSLCIDAFVARNMPAWQRQLGSMAPGFYTFEVTAQRRER